MRCFLFVSLFCATAEAKNYAIVVGNNALPLDSAEANLQELRFADDDAAAMHALLLENGVQSHLLTVLDEPSQRKFPGLAATSLLPTLANLARVVNDIGDADSVIFYFSGHGSMDGVGEPFLALLDGKLTRDVLYDQVLAKLNARMIHLVVDACHAAAVVRPRGGTPITLAPQEVTAISDERTLARFPNVGTFIATSRVQLSHEWDAVDHGVFTHVLLSGLRGAADVNGDGRLEYSELHAFTAAATRAIQDERARLQPIVHAPKSDLRAPLLVLRQSDGNAIVTATSPGRIAVEDAHGVLLVDANIENGAVLRLSLPAKQTLFVHRGADKESEVALAPHSERDLDQLAWRARSTRPRGSITNALFTGLFKETFGPTYYRAYVDTSGDISVEFKPHTLALQNQGRKRATIGVIVAGGVSLAVVLAATPFFVSNAAAYQNSELQRPSHEAFTRMQSAGVIMGVAGGLSAAAIVAAAVLWPSTPSGFAWAPTLDRPGVVLTGVFK